MALAQIIAAISAGMTARLPGLSYLTGARNIGTNKTGNSVVFVPTQDDFAPGRQQRSTIPGSSRVVDRVVALRVVRLEVRLWGVATKANGTRRKVGDTVFASGDRDDLAQVDLMISALVNALDDAATVPNFQIESGQYLDQTGEQSTQAGTIYVARITLNVPIVYLSLAQATVDPDTMVVTGQIEDGQTESPES
jgi:hypothetical protein